MARNTAIPPMCIVTLTDQKNKDGKRSGYLLDAVQEFEQKLVDHNCESFVVTITPPDGISIIMFAVGSCRGPEGFTDEKLSKMTWDIEREFDYKVLCTSEIKTGNVRCKETKDESKCDI